jgi:hypothetical protein
MVFRHAQLPGLANVSEWIVVSKLFYGDVILGRIIGDNYIRNDRLLFENGPNAFFQKLRPVATQNYNR